MLTMTSLGGAGTVTGSKHLLEHDGKRILIDCGLFQGMKNLRELNWEPLPVPPASIDAVILTHAHLDHSGYLPRLVRDGFRGRIYATAATRDVAALILKDSAHLNEKDAAYLNRIGATRHKPALPLYNSEDAERALELFTPVPFSEVTELPGGAKVTFRHAGHILGAATADVEWGGRRVVFSGDLGRYSDPFMLDPEPVREADFVVIESTYGNRLHEDDEHKEVRLREILLQAVSDKEKVIIPAFAVGRTQDLLYTINKLYRAGSIPLIPIYVDSPLAVSATEVFTKHSELFDQETREYLRTAQSPFNYPALTLVRDLEDSKELNEIKGPAIIISASGMCEAGRIKHHLKHNLWRRSAHILFVGFQAEGTLGRRIRDGAKTVTIFGEEIAVKANIHALDGFSAHADQAGLLEWLRAFERKPRAVFVTHGEADARREFAALVQRELNFKSVVPLCDESFDLTQGDLFPLAARKEVAEESALTDLDALWQQVRPALLRQLNSGGRRSGKDAQRLAQKLEEAMREVRNRLS
jgi:metallo-beta-lactamase family protein